MKRIEGFIDVPKAGKVWYEVVGGNKMTPLITLHGGPGYPHDSLKSLEDLSNERQIIFYDQLGCGNSQRINDKSLWTAKYFVKELKTVIKELGVKEYNILGQSWGSALALLFALTKPNGLKSLILADPYISTPIWEKDAKRLIKKLPSDMQKALRGGKTKSKKYKKASREYYLRYIFGIGMKKRPVHVIKASNKMNHDIYEYMWGKDEFSVSETLKTLDLSKRLHEIKVPVLFLCGRNDEATPESTEYFKSLTPKSKIKIFEKSAHFPNWTERKEYIKTISKFLNEN